MDEVAASPKDLIRNDGLSETSPSLANNQQLLIAGGDSKASATRPLSFGIPAPGIATAACNKLMVNL